MGAVSPREALDAIQDWGVSIRRYEPDGRPWQSNTTAGGWEPIGVAHHHTGGSRAVLEPNSLSQKAMLRLLRMGRSDLDGPLCHFAPLFAGAGKRVAYAIGWGNVNHAGLVAANVVRAVRTGDYRGERPGSDALDGNSLFYGLEYLHPGLEGVRWPDELLDTGHRIGAALCEAHGWNPESWAGSQVEHRELTTRKPDRAWAGAGDGMRRAINEMAQAELAGRRSQANGWVRPDSVRQAIRLLRTQARNYDGQPRKAKALRQEARHLAEKFPRDR